MREKGETEAETEGERQKTEQEKEREKKLECDNKKRDGETERGTEG